jgi:hypothetical protein
MEVSALSSKEHLKDILMFRTNNLYDLKTVRGLFLSSYQDNYCYNYYGEAFTCAIGRGRETINIRQTIINTTWLDEKHCESCG